MSAATPIPPLQRHISEALAALPRTQRDAFLLVHLEGFTVSEAAAIMGRATGTLKSNLHRARMALRRRLDGVLETPGESR